MILDFLETLGSVEFLGRLFFCIFDMLNYSNFKLWSLSIFNINFLCVSPILTKLDFLESLE